MFRAGKAGPVFRKLRPLVDSIGFRLLAPLCVAVGLVLAVHSLLSYRSTQQHFMRFVRADARRCSDLIERATHDGMLLNRLDQVQAAFERLVDGSDIAAIRCYDKQGVIVLSADRGEIGRRIDLESATCTSCHDRQILRGSAVLERSSLVRMPESRDVLRHLSAIRNEASCSTAACHAHPADRKVLGVLEVEMSLAPLDVATGAAQSQLVRTTGVLLLIVGAVAALFVQRVVRRPIRKFRAGTERIARGDLTTRIDIPGQNELAELARAFNNMVDELGTARTSLTEWSQTLEEKVAEKTEELRRAQGQVMQMERMASLGKLAASVAHELNNPLAGMLTYARLIRRELEEQPLDSPVREELSRYLEIVERECRRCGEIVKNLLTFARPSGIRMARFDLNEIVDRSLLLVRHHLEMRNVQLQSELLTADSEIVADADRIEQALLALLVNAVESMNQTPPGEGCLHVALKADVDWVQIDISDNGVGIPPDVIPHIFEPFFSTKQQERGVGLGLAVVYGIVQRHGGSIAVESQPGHGTTFSVRLPRQPPQIEEATSSGDASSGPMD